VQRWRRWFAILVPTTGCLVTNPAWVGDGDGGSAGVASMSRGDDEDDEDGEDGEDGEDDDDGEGTLGVTSTDPPEDDGEGTLGPPPGSTSQPPPADWWDTAWKYRRIVDLNLPTPLGDPLQVAIRIDGSDDPLRFSELGEDVRFVSGSGEPIAFDIDAWQPLDGSGALVWVRLVPGLELEPLYMYYGNPSASPRVESSDVWMQEYDAVWHLGSGLDASGQSSELDPFVVVEPGQLADSAVFDTLGGQPVNASLGDVSPQSVTITAWILPLSAGEGGEGRIVDLKVPITELDVALHITSSQAPPALAASVASGGAIATSILPDFPLDLGVWHFVALTLDEGGEVRLYVDGDGGGAEDLAAEMGVPPMLMGSSVVIGGSQDGDPTRFDGNIDEVRIRPASVPGEQIYAEYIAQIGEAAALGFEEQI